MRRVGSYEAKTHLPRILEDVSRGEVVTITKHGRPVAVIRPAEQQLGSDAESAAADLRAFRIGHLLNGVTLRELIDEGRR